jgi:hypothetical protein
LRIGTGTDADRHRNTLIYFASEGAGFGAYPQGKRTKHWKPQGVGRDSADCWRQPVPARDSRLLPTGYAVSDRAASMFSMPPATAVSTKPIKISCGAETVSCAPEPQTRFQSLRLTCKSNAPAALSSMMLTLHEIWHLPREIGNDGRSHGRDRLERCSESPKASWHVTHVTPASTTWLLSVSRSGS